MEIKETFKISKQFSAKPGARYIDDGDNSGEAFLQQIRPRLDKAINEGYLIEIDLEGLFGFPASFVSGSFGKLSIEKGSDILLKHLVFKSEDNPLRAEKAIREISNPRKVTPSN